GHVDVPGIDYAAILPLLIILGAACLGVLLEAFLPQRYRWSSQVTLSLLALGGAVIALALYAKDAPDSGITTFSGTLSVDNPALFLWGTLIALAVAALLLIADRSMEPGGGFVAEAGISPGTIQDREQASST